MLPVDNPQDVTAETLRQFFGGTVSLEQCQRVAAQINRPEDVMSSVLTARCMTEDDGLAAQYRFRNQVCRLT